MILANKIDTKERAIAGLDWSRKEVIVNVKGQPLAYFSSLAEAAPNYKGYIWALEATADSFELQNRQIDLKAIEDNDIKAYCFNPRFTSKHRIIWNDIAKTDEADSEVIRRIFTETPLTCCKFKELVEKDELREDIQNFLIKDRRQYDGELTLPFAQKYLPSFEETPKQFLEFLYDTQALKVKKPKKPRTPKKPIGRFLFIATKVRQSGKGFRTFRKQIGNYGQGYGCMARSEFQWWWVKSIVNSRLKTLGIPQTKRGGYIDPKTKEAIEMRIWMPEEIKVKKQTFKESDKVLKWLWNLTA